jgi:hypothetical protein
MSEDFDDGIDGSEIPVSTERDMKKFWIVLALTNLAFLIIIIRLFIIQVSDAQRFKD